MKTNIHFFLSNLLQFLFEWEIFQANAVMKINTYEYIYVEWLFSFLENLAVYDIMWKNSAEPDRPQMAICRMRIACWVPKATNTYSRYVILLDFPLQNGYTDTPEDHLRTSPVLFNIYVS